MAMTAQVAADLRAAADVLQRDGWTQGQYHRPRNGALCHCAEGAIALATGAHRNARPRAERHPIPFEIDAGELTDYLRWAAADDTLRRHLDRGIADWNDQPGRTADEVIAALRAAADAADTHRADGQR